MGKRLEKLTPRLIEFINDQKIFFVATAMPDGKINLSPKGLDGFRVLDPNTVLWLNLTGSGNETAAHVQHDGRMTIMFCAFEGNPLILRLYGRAQAYHQNSNIWKEYLELFSTTAGARQLIEMKIDLVQTSCGMGVLLMEYQTQRTELVSWAKHKGEKGLQEYWEQKNSESLDGCPTAIFD